MEHAYQSGASAVKQFLERSFRQTIPQSFLEWIDEHFYLSADATNTRGKRWTSYGYQKFIINVVADLDIERVGLIKPTQVGWTQILKAFLGYEVAHRKRTTCIWQPRTEDFRDFSNVQIASLLRDVPAVAAELKTEVGKRDQENTTARRGFKAATLYARAAMSGPNFERISIQSAGADEYDSMPANVDGKGSPAELITGRMDAADFPKLIVGGTPRIKGESNIESFIEECREVFRRYIPCPHCDHMQTLIWGDPDSHHGMKWNKVFDGDGKLDELRTAETVHYVCQSCSGTFNYNDFRKLDGRGEWRSKNLRVPDNDYTYYSLETGEKVRKPESVGVRLWGAYSYSLSWVKGCQRFLAAIRLARSGKNESLIRWINEYKGETYSPTETNDLPDWKILKARKEQWNGEVPYKAQLVTHWWDVQDDRLEGGAVAWGFEEESWNLDYYVIVGDPYTTRLLHKAGEYHKKIYRYADGRELPVAISGMDHGHLADKVEEVCKLNHTQMIPTKGASNRGKPVADMPNTKNAKGVYLTIIGTDTAKDTIAARLKLDVPGPGYIHFADVEKHDDYYFKMVTAEYKKTQYLGGQTVDAWFCPKGKRNEAFDVMVGNLAMIRILQQRYGVKLIEIEDEPLQPGGISNDKKENELSAFERAANRAKAYRKK